MDGNEIRKKWRITCLVFIFVLLTIILIISYFAYTGMERNKQDALHAVEVYAARTESLLTNLFHKTDILESILITSRGELSDEIFQDLARSLNDMNGIRAIQCLPDGVVKYCYPMEGNELAFGENIFENPRRKDDAMLALNTKKIALSGPYELTQGGLGLVARNPIFFTNAEGKEIFWGFSVIILDLPEALDPIMLDELVEDGYVYRLHCISEMDENLTIVQSNEPIIKQGIDYDIHVPNHVWTLSIEPRNGWIDWNVVIFELLIGMLVSFLCASIAYQHHERTYILNQSANTDSLTGLYNRRWLDQKIGGYCTRSTNESFFLLYFDLDKFKQINDTLGHTRGDLLLQEFSKCVRSSLGKDGVLARVGGDEFVAVVESKNDPAQDVVQMIAKIESVLPKSLMLEGIPCTVAVSIGYAVFPEDGTDYEQLIKVADERMYQVKMSKKKSGI